MEDPQDERLPEELQHVIRRLHAERAELDPMGMDQLKRRVLARARGNQQRGGFMKSRIATIVTLAALVGGSGGALALAGSNSSKTSNGSSASAQYKPGKGCGDKNHQHTGSQGNNKPCPQLKKKHHGGSTQGGNTSHGNTSHGNSGHGTTHSGTTPKHTAATSGVSTGSSTPAAAGSGLDTGSSVVTLHQVIDRRFGAILVDQNGNTMYVFSRDGKNQNVCQSNPACAAMFRPVLTSGTPSGSGLSGTVSEIALSAGGQQVSYAGHPLYTLASNTGPDDTSAVGASKFGGTWAAISPSGQSVK